MGIFYAALGVYDSLALLNSILFIQFLPSLGISLPAMSHFACHFFSIYRRTAIQTPSWMLVIITLDRFRSVCYPTKFKFMEKKKFILKVIVFLFLAIFLLNADHGWFYLVIRQTNQINFDPLLNTSTNTTIKKKICTASPLLLSITDIKMVFMRSYIPFTLMLFLNVKLSRVFLLSKKKFRPKEHDKKEYSFTTTVLIMNLVFFVLYLPWSVWYAVWTAFKFVPGAMTSQASAQLRLCRSILFSVAYLNNCSSFFVNFFINFQFRKELMDIFRVIKKKKVSSTIIQSTDNSSSK
ncbi:G-coupled receptor -like protein [Brachionus plicatilis]|uniref:G-coupled receptor-like protein n=1 Tax=Brachionus plicatilis TaxID=10195 RepID=A0A3M7R7K7_BRAPC|nr:G-coupled receptor -like protein [Brachionus plicatilis]